MSPRPSVRHCPLCGIAMQTSHGEQGETRFDCQTCHSSIVERPVTRDAEHGEKD